MTKRVLGINCFGHDAAATLIEEGAIVAACEEERLSRKKHDSRFPLQAIQFCLKQGKLSLSELDAIAYFVNPWEEIPFVIKHFFCYFPHSLHLFRGAATGDSFQKKILRQLFFRYFIKKQMKEEVPPVYYVSHHVAHAASAFFASPFETSALLTIDALGGEDTTWLGTAGPQRFQKIQQVRFPHSLGFFYSAFTDFLGFEANDGEWKVMGLAPYGSPRYLDFFRELITFDDLKGTFHLNMKYFQFHLYGKKKWLSSLVGKKIGPRAILGQCLTERHCDIAASLQARTEEIMVALARFLQARTKCENLCMAGGVALNCVANTKILEQTRFKEIFVQPASGDAGTSLGAAYYVYRFILGGMNRVPMASTSLGPDFSPEEIEKILLQAKLAFTKPSCFMERVADLLAQGKIVGWFQGRMEFGPRALGYRSILGDPRRAEMKELINQRVKFRERFRPFAPAILETYLSDYYHTSFSAAPFMTFAFPIRREKRDEVPAIVHQDGTSRVQTVSRENHPLFWQLLEAFRKRTGVPILLNTSFNVRGEPIVCTPQDAVRCFQQAGLDVLAIGPYLVEKKCAPG